MRRRDFLASVGAATAIWPTAPRTQRATVPLMANLDCAVAPQSLLTRYSRVKDPTIFRSNNRPGLASDAGYGVKRTFRSCAVGSFCEKTSVQERSAREPRQKRKPELDPSGYT